jgi:Sulfatase-modifying factor enzyme 1/Domain of unknown function (DUF4388)
MVLYARIDHPYFRKMIGSGFSGTFEDFELIDLIEVSCYSGKPTTILVSEGNRKGVVNIDKGLVLHAAVAGKQGMEALYELVRWRNGKVELKSGIPPEIPRTVTTRTDHVMMMAVQQLDERLAGAGELAKEPGSRFNSVVAGEIRDQILARARRRRWFRILRKVALVSAGIIILGLVLYLAAGNRDKIAGFVSSFSESRSIPEEGGTVLIPPGEFIYGDGVRVRLDSFDIDRTEVTIGQYAEFLTAIRDRSDYDHPAQPIAKRGHSNAEWEALYKAASSGSEFQGVRVTRSFPAVFLDWFDAYAYAKWKGRRLPSEQEWEKAARGTDGRRFPWGSEESSTKANTFNGDPTKKWAEAGSFPEDRGPYGVFDMAGNVSEWTGSWDENQAVVRGGNFGNPNAEISRRVIKEDPLTLSDRIGFRTAGSGR